MEEMEGKYFRDFLKTTHCLQAPVAQHAAKNSAAWLYY